MFTFHSRSTTPVDFFQSDLPTQSDSKIPFLFAAVPHKLFDYGLKPSTIGVYSGLARYVNWKAQMTIDDRKVITGWTPPVSQEKLADLLNTSRQTIIHHLQILAQADVIEFRKSFRGCYQYRLIAYKDGIEEIKQQAQERNWRNSSGGQQNYSSPRIPFEI